MMEIMLHANYCGMKITLLSDLNAFEIPVHISRMHQKHFHVRNLRKHHIKIIAKL